MDTRETWRNEKDMHERTKRDEKRWASDEIRGRRKMRMTEIKRNTKDEHEAKKRDEKHVHKTN